MTQEKIKKRPKIKRKTIIIILSVAVVLVAGAAAFFYYSMPKGYTEINQTGDVISNDTIEVTFISAETTSHIIGYTMDDGYVYVLLSYNVKNISDGDISWKKFPYISIMRYDQKGNTYTQVKDSEAEFDFNALQSYAMQQGIDYSNVKEDMTSGEVRADADVIKIPEDEFDVNKYFITIDNIKTIVKIDDKRMPVAQP